MTIFNTTTIRLGVGDILRVLFGKAIHIATQIEVAAEVEVVDTRQQVRVEPLIARKKQPDASMMAATLN